MFAIMATRIKPSALGADAGIQYDKENWPSSGKSSTKEPSTPNARKALQPVSLNQPVAPSPISSYQPCSSVLLPATPTLEEEKYDTADLINDELALVEEELDDVNVVDLGDDAEFQNFLQEQAEEDFRVQLASICSTLSDTQKNWASRSKALSKIQALVKVTV